MEAGLNRSVTDEVRRSEGAGGFGKQNGGVTAARTGPRASDGADQARAWVLLPLRACRMIHPTVLAVVAAFAQHPRGREHDQSRRKQYGS